MEECRFRYRWNTGILFRVIRFPSASNVGIKIIRNRVPVTLGVDAAVVTSIGLLAYLGHRIPERLTGISMATGARNTFSNVFLAPRPDEESPNLKRCSPLENGSVHLVSRVP